MITKLLVAVREVYEEEETETQFQNINTQKVISTWDFEHNTPDEEKKNYIRQEVPTGKMVRKEKDEPEYAQVFELNNLKVADLVLYLNRIK